MTKFRYLQGTTMRMRRKGIVSRFGGDESGAIAIWVAVGMPMIMGIAALAFDMNQLYVTKARLQHTADAAAIAAAQALPDQSAVITAAQNYATMNMPSATHGIVVASGDVTMGNWDPDTRVFTPSGIPENEVRVSARRDQQNGNPVPTSFANALGISNVDVSASSVATIGSEACIIALNPAASKAFYIQGNASVRTSNCDIQVNSCHSVDALKGQGNTVVEITSTGNNQINVCGAAKAQGPASFSPAPNANTGEQVTDPFAGVANPAASLYDGPEDCDFTNFFSTGTVTLTPGVYCGGISLAGNGTATFASGGGSLTDGLFIIKDGELSINGNVDIVANGVTFFMTGSGANLNFGGTADVGISAPTTGNYAGFVVVGDRDNPASSPHVMRGTAMGGYNGYIYLPNAKLLMSGTATGSLGTSDCTVAVADTFEFSGTPNFEAEGGCTDFGGGFSAGGAVVVN
jgi:hypothetical protein